MAITSGLFNSINGDRRYDAEWFARYFALLVDDGVFANPSTGMQVIQNENLSTIVRPGDGWIKGYFIVNDSNYVLEHDLADGVLKRIDRIVMRLNFLSRQIEIDIKKGTFASVPVAPELQRDADYYELALADVLINNGATQIIQANITDTRFNKSLCGIVTNPLDSIDTTDLFAQYTDAFNRWFENLQAQLDENVATNLQNQIDQHNAAQLPHRMTDTVTGASYRYGLGIENGEFCIMREVIE